jgi:hypothetical protein
MKKQTLWLLVIGNLCMAFTLFASPFFNVPNSIGDFLKGFGVTFVVSALFVQRKMERTS